MTQINSKPMRRWFALGAILMAALLLVAAGPRTCAAGGHGHAAPAHGDAGDADEELESPTGRRGIEIGDFSIRTYRSVSGQKNRVKFTLYVTVKNDGVKDFRKRLEHRTHKVRDQVIVATRLTPVEDYDDPELTKLRRRIQLRLRRMMPELLIEEILVSDFTLSIESS
jgi:hypothetical protein